MDDQFERTMSISHAEFYRLLPRALGGQPFSRTGHRVEVQLGQGRLMIQLSEQAVRQIASLKLPQTRIEFQFAGVDEVVKTDFLSRFELAYQRGGG